MKYMARTAETHPDRETRLRYDFARRILSGLKRDLCEEATYAGVIEDIFRELMESVRETFDESRRYGKYEIIPWDDDDYKQAVKALELRLSKEGYRIVNESEVQ